MRAAGLALALLASSVACPARAQPGTSVVLVVEGRGAGAFAREVRAGLEEAGLRVAAAPRAEAAAIAAAEGAESILVVRVTSRRVVLSRLAADGAARDAPLSVPRARGPAAARRAALALLGRGAADPEALDPDPGAGSDAETSAEAEPSAPGSTASQPSAVRSSRGDVTAPRATPAPTTAPASDTAPIAAFDATVGGGARTRSFTLLRPDGRGVAYHAPLFAELRVDAEARLLDVAFVRGRFGSSLGLETRLDESNRADALYLRAAVEAGARLPLDPVQIGVSFGVAWDRFEQPFDERLPTADYLALRPAASVAIRFVSWLALDAELGARVALGAGDLESVYGVDRSVYGLDVTARLRLEADFGLRVTLEAGVTRYWLELRGPAGPTRGADESLSVALLAGYGLP
ncbi:MAG: hypothetical protein KF729_17545 [Sandaracinaceae bacterium]|nr:hypothetical protein [Sandaracinaceae bacterium]